MRVTWGVLVLASLHVPQEGAAREPPARKSAEDLRQQLFVPTRPGAVPGARRAVRLERKRCPVQRRAQLRTALFYDFLRAGHRYRQRQLQTSPSNQEVPPIGPRRPQPRLPLRLRQRFPRRKPLRSGHQPFLRAGQDRHAHDGFQVHSVQRGREGGVRDVVPRGLHAGFRVEVCPWRFFHAPLRRVHRVARFRAAEDGHRPADVAGQVGEGLSVRGEHVRGVSDHADHHDIQPGALPRGGSRARNRALPLQQQGAGGGKRHRLLRRKKQPGGAAANAVRAGRGAGGRDRKERRTRVQPDRNRRGE
mmetsp:Transcript_26404/g.66633  ORF Transcript_26404/g.66633 Transcript_26404/m.66633 type:complete len:305 (+) Transcript_26404:2053-2967(+)